jgi:hypothetical protein
VLINRSRSDSATTGFGNSGYQSLGARLLVRISGLAAIARSETRSLEIVALGRGVLAHREVIDDEHQGAGVFTHALTDGAISVSTGQVGEHPRALYEPDVAAAPGYLVSECLCHMVFPTPTVQATDCNSFARCCRAR